jgi:hypothetical protein
MKLAQENRGETADLTLHLAGLRAVYLEIFGQSHYSSWTYEVLRD